MRINWFSPLNPARTGVAQYSNMIVPWLARHAEVCVWTPQQQFDRSILKHAEVRHFSADALPWPELNRADLTFFHLGNDSGFHLEICLASMQYPGIIILHDVYYPDFFNGVRERLRAAPLSGPAEVIQRLKRASEASTANPYEPLQILIENSIAALVHSPAEFDPLVRTLPCPVIFAPFPYAPASPDTFQQWTKLRDEKRKRKRLIIFGYLGSNRCVNQVLDVLAKFPSQFELHLCGPLSDRVLTEQRIKSLGLKDSVLLTGYTDNPDPALAQADLAVNLRNPTMGEASLSQLKIWDHALPSIVTRTGWYSYLPENSAFFVKLDSEREDLTRHLEAYLADPDQFAQAGAAGRLALIANHSPDDYARAIVGLGEHSQSFQSAAAARQLGSRVGQELTLWTDSDDRAYTGHIAQEITQLLG